jgi:hypothetical protein
MRKRIHDGQVEVMPKTTVKGTFVYGLKDGVTSCFSAPKLVPKSKYQNLWHSRFLGRSWKL